MNIRVIPTIIIISNVRFKACTIFACRIRYIYNLLNTCTAPRNVDVLVTEPFTIKKSIFTTHDFVLYQNLGFPSIFVLKNIISLATFPP